MRIDDVHRLQAYGSTMKQQPDKTEKKPSASVSHPDQVEISEKAREQMKEALRSEKVDRVESLKQQIQAGTYHVPGEWVADKMLQYLRLK